MKNSCEENFSVGGCPDEILKKIDAGQLRAAEKIDGEWKANESVKQAILQSGGELQAVVSCSVWVLRTQSSTRAASALNC